MPAIAVDHNPTEETLACLGARTWPTWTKEVSTFPWTYATAETCLFLEGEVVVTPDGGEPVAVGAGDLVTFPAGMSCTWEVRRPVRKHYQFAD